MDAIKRSFLYRFLLRIDSQLCRWWEQSLPGRWLTDQDPSESVFTPGRRAGCRLRSTLCGIFEALRIPALLENSLFLHPALFAAAALILAPLAPTMVILMLVCGCFLSMILKFGVDRNAGICPAPLNAHIGLYTFVVFWSTATSVNLTGSLFPGLLTMAFVLFYFGVTSAGLEKHLNHVLWLLLAVGTAVSLYGFYQFANPEQYSNVWTDTDLFSTIAFRVYSTLENPNVLGEYLLLIIPIGCAMLLCDQSWGKRLACLAAVGIMGVCLILTYSRGCYLGLLAAAAVFLVLLDRRFLFLGLIAVALCPLYLPESVISRFTSIGNLADTSTSYRVRIWFGVLDMLRDYGFSGVGFGSAAFNTVYPAYAYHGVTAQHAHNLFLQILCDSGIVGLAAFLGLIVSFYRMMLTALRYETDRRARLLQIGGTCSVTGFLVQSLTDYTFYNYRVMLLFFAVLGLCVLFTRAGKQEAWA